MLKQLFKKKSTPVLLSACALVMTMGAGHQAQAAEPFIAEVKMFASNFAPRGYALCDGQLLQISQNVALFSLVGTIYGGDGRTTFALPDLRGRTAIHPGRGPVLEEYRIGQRGGSEYVTLTVQQMPSHTHTATSKGINSSGNTNIPGGNTLASKSRTNIYSTNAPAVDMHAGSVTVANTGGGQSHENRMPYLGINHIIALTGLFPSRS